MSVAQEKGNELAVKVEAWLSLSGQKQRRQSAELRQFIADLKAGRLADLAGVNYERILPFVERRGRPSLWLQIARNVLIFVPIMLTWYALREAVIEFSRSAKVDDNFLIYWEKLDGFAKLSTVALLDVLIIVVIVVLTAVSGYVDIAENMKVTQSYEGLIISLERSLAAHRFLSLGEMNSVVEDTLKYLRAAADEINRSTSELAKSSSEAGQAVTGVIETTRNIFQPVVEKLDVTVSALGGAAAIHQDMVSVVQQLRTDFAQELSTLKQGFSALLAEVETRSRSIVATTESQLAQGVGGLNDSARIVSQDLALLVGNRLDEMTKRLAQGVESVERTAQAASSSLAREITDKLTEVANDLSKTAKEMKQVAMGAAETAAIWGNGALLVKSDLEGLHEMLRDYRK